MRVALGNPREIYKISPSGGQINREVILKNGKRVTTQISLGHVQKKVTDAHSLFYYAYLRSRSPPTQTGNQRVRIVDLFSGCGGLSLGAMEACRATEKKFVPVAAFDKDPASLEVYDANFGPRYLYPQRVEKIIRGEIFSPFSREEKQLEDNLDSIDLLIAGPPCQGYSDLNNHSRRKDPRNALYERVARFAEIVKPANILIENVSTVIHGKEESVSKTSQVLQELGYNVDEGVVDSAKVGVPQRRKRHFLIGSLDRSHKIEKIIQAYAVDYVPSVEWAIHDIEDEPITSIFNKPSRLSEKNVQRIEYLHKHDVYDLPQFLRPPCHQGEKCSYPSMYGRIKYSEPAQTITTGFSSPGQGRYVHPQRKRTLTPHEAARLQFFPDFFDFSSVEYVTPLKRMIGNAVPMKLAYVFCIELLA